MESNFILEIALGQEQALAAEAILARAEQGGVKLALPAFSLSEPFHTIRQRGRNRKRLEDQVGEQMHDLERSMPHQQDASALSALAGILAQVDKRESDRLLGTIARVLAVADIVQTDASSFSAALAYVSRYGLSAQDAIIYAAVIDHLGTQNPREQHYFMNRNWTDFGAFDIRAELRDYGCEFVPSFTEGAIRLELMDKHGRLRHLPDR